jgi:hypothetical protein
MENTKSLKGQKYRAVIIDKHDPTTQGRYAVFCFELHHQASKDPKDDYIWAKNRVHNYRLGSEETFYGQYHPLHPNQNCYINFETNDINSAYISELIDDVVTKAKPNTLPFNLKLTDRDQVTVIGKTLNNHHSFIITEASSVSPQSIQILYNNGIISLVFDDNGAHLNVSNEPTGSNEPNRLLNISVGGDVNIKVGGNFNVEAKTINLKGDTNIEGTINLKGDTNIEGTINLKGDIRSDKITGSITHADKSSSSGNANDSIAGGAGNAAGNLGHETTPPILVAKYIPPKEEDKK